MTTTDAPFLAERRQRNNHHVREWLSHLARSGLNRNALRVAAVLHEYMPKMDEGRGCFPSVRRIAADLGGMYVRQVQMGLKQLEAVGAIERWKHPTSRRASMFYRARYLDGEMATPMAHVPPDYVCVRGNVSSCVRQNTVPNTVENTATETAMPTQKSKPPAPSAQSSPMSRRIASELRRLDAQQNRDAAKPEQDVRPKRRTPCLVVRDGERETSTRKQSPVQMIAQSIENAVLVSMRVPSRVEIPAAWFGIIGRARKRGTFTDDELAKAIFGHVRHVAHDKRERRRWWECFHVLGAIGNDENVRIALRRYDRYMAGENRGKRKIERGWKHDSEAAAASTHRGIH